MNRPIRLLPAFLSVGSWTMVSRVLGLLRDILMAAFLGTGPVAQAFLIAFTLPNMFRRFFAEGAFNLAFVPMFAKKVEAGEDAEGFARDALSGLGAVLIVLVVAGWLVMPWLVLAMASGFAGDERFTLSVEHGRIAFPYILFISLTALLSGVLNSLGRFALAAAAPILMNVVMIAFLLTGWWTHGNIGLWQIWSVPVAGVAQLALVWWGCARVGMPVLPALAAADAGTAAPRRRRRARRCSRAAWCRSTCWSAARSARSSTAPSPGSPTPTGSTSCRSASSASPSASCCCPTSRAG